MHLLVAEPNPDFVSFLRVLESLLSGGTSLETTAKAFTDTVNLLGGLPTRLVLGI